MPVASSTNNLTDIFQYPIPLQNPYFQTSTLISSNQNDFIMIEDETYFQPESIIRRLQEILQSRADESHRMFLQNSLEGIPVRGVRMQEIRFAVTRWHSSWRVDQQTVPAELELTVALRLFGCPHHEDQLASILFIDEQLIPHGTVTNQHLPQFSKLFDENFITNYKVCDHFAAKVLQALITRYGLPVVNVITSWFLSPVLLKARCALGALIPFASDAIYDEQILDGCHKLGCRPDDLAKNIVATALKALGKRESIIVETFLEKDFNLATTSAQSLKKACECFPNTQFKRFSERRKVLVQQGMNAVAEEQIRNLIEIQISQTNQPITPTADQINLPVEDLEMSQDYFTSGSSNAGSESEPINTEM